MIKTVIADDHPLIRNGFKSILQSSDSIEILGEAGDGEALLHLLSTCEPDVVLLDIHMPRMNGVEACKVMRELHPGVAVLALSMSAETADVKAMWHLDVKGYLLKDADPEEILRAVKTIHGGGRHYSAHVLGVIDGLLNRSNESQGAATPRFSPTEIRILEHLCEGLTCKEIGCRVQLARKTVEHYLERIREKTGTKNATEIAVYAITHNLVRAK